MVEEFIEIKTGIKAKDLPVNTLNQPTNIEEDDVSITGNKEDL